MLDEMFYEETPQGLDFSKMWSKEGREALEAAEEVVMRSKGPASCIKNLIDNPDLNQHQTEVAVAYIQGVHLGFKLLSSIEVPNLDKFMRDLFGR